MAWTDETIEAIVAEATVAPRTIIEVQFAWPSSALTPQDIFLHIDTSKSMAGITCALIHEMTRRRAPGVSGAEIRAVAEQMAERIKAEAEKANG